jgi:hypothetical protein
MVGMSCPTVVERVMEVSFNEEVMGWDASSAKSRLGDDIFSYFGNEVVGVN